MVWLAGSGQSRFLTLKLCSRCQPAWPLLQLGISRCVYLIHVGHTQHPVGAVAVSDLHDMYRLLATQLIFGFWTRRLDVGDLVVTIDGSVCDVTSGNDTEIICTTNSHQGSIETKVSLAPWRFENNFFILSGVNILRESLVTAQQQATAPVRLVQWDYGSCWNFTFMFAETYDDGLVGAGALVFYQLLFC